MGGFCIVKGTANLFLTATPNISISNMEIDWDENSPGKAMIVIESNIDNFHLNNIKRKI